MIEHALGTLYPRLERRGFTAFFSASTLPAEKKSCVWKRCPATDTLPAGRFPCFGSTWRSPSNFTCTRNFASSFLRKVPCTISFPRTTSTWISSVPRKTGASHRLLTASSSPTRSTSPATPRGTSPSWTTCGSLPVTLVWPAFGTNVVDAVGMTAAATCPASSSMPIRMRRPLWIGIDSNPSEAGSGCSQSDSACLPNRRNDGPSLFFRSSVTAPGNV